MSADKPLRNSVDKGRYKPMTKKKITKRTKRAKPLFEKMKPKKGFVSVQFVVAVSSTGKRGCYVVDRESAEYSAACARSNIDVRRGMDYDDADAMRAEAVLHLVECYLPIPKRPVVKKAKARTKKLASDLAVEKDD